MAATPKPQSAGRLARLVTLRQLQILEAVARLGSFTRAAEELFLAQPTVSMQLRKLADTVGEPLFEQVGVRIYATQTGRELYQASREVFDALSRFEMRVADLRGLKHGRLRLAVVTTAKFVAPHLLGQFSRAHPGIEVALVVTNRERLLERMADNLDDLYILGQPPDGANVECDPFVPNPLVVMASREHPLAGGRDIPLARLADEPFIMREPGSGTRDAVERLFASRGLRVPVRMELGSNEAVKQAIGAGLGISILSLHALVLEGTAGRIAVLDVQGFPIRRQWYLAHPVGKELSVVARAFREFVRDEGKRIAESLEREFAPPPAAGPAAGSEPAPRRSRRGRSQAAMASR